MVEQRSPKPLMWVQLLLPLPFSFLYRVLARFFFTFFFIFSNLSIIIGKVKPVYKQFKENVKSGELYGKY